MTLHWWMHWFWVTLLVTLYASTGTSAPQSEQPSITENPELPIEPTLPEPSPAKQSDRQGRAMYFDKAPSTLTPSNVTENQTDKAITLETKNNHSDTNTSIADIATPANTTESVHPSIIWTAVNTTENITKINHTETEQNSTQAPRKRNLTRPDIIKDDINIDFESRTERPLSLETSYQTRIPPNVGSSRMVVDQDGMDTGAIAGISFAALVLVALAGSTAFVLYRRRYLNKPQTLNDKCSNPDSSGYLDDSTIRDNSEEMYSLDNDSFLNSLEAMTIQNYWTDTVKHTKL